MKNVTLANDLNAIISKKVEVTKRETSNNIYIDVVSKEPVFVDLGSYVYKSVEDRDADFLALETAINKAK